MIEILQVFHLRLIIKEHYDTPILGKHNMKNATIAIAVGHELGLTYNTIYQNLKMSA